MYLGPGQLETLRMCGAGLSILENCEQRGMSEVYKKLLEYHVTKKEKGDNCHTSSPPISSIESSSAECKQ